LLWHRHGRDFASALSNPDQKATGVPADPFFVGVAAAGATTVPTSMRTKNSAAIAARRRSGGT